MQEGKLQKKLKQDGKLNWIEMLRDVGRHFSVNRMLTMDSVRLRLEREQEMSFIEFNYMVCQAYDFVELARRTGCRLQMGGSDQWGNIVMGADLVRRMQPLPEGLDLPPVLRLQPRPEDLQPRPVLLVVLDLALVRRLQPLREVLDLAPVRRLQPRHEDLQLAPVCGLLLLHRDEYLHLNARLLDDGAHFVTKTY